MDKDDKPLYEATLKKSKTKKYDTIKECLHHIENERGKRRLRSCWVMMDFGRVWSDYIKDGYSDITFHLYYAPFY